MAFRGCWDFTRAVMAGRVPVLPTTMERFTPGPQKMLGIHSSSYGSQGTSAACEDVGRLFSLLARGVLWQCFCERTTPLRLCRICKTVESGQTLPMPILLVTHCWLSCGAKDGWHYSFICLPLGRHAVEPTAVCLIRSFVCLWADTQWRQPFGILCLQLSAGLVLVFAAPSR